MRITLMAKDGSAIPFERGNTKEDRANAASFILSRVRCRYTPESKARAKAFAKAN